MTEIQHRKNLIINEIFSIEDELQTTFGTDNEFEMLTARLKELEEELDSINHQLKAGGDPWRE